MSDVVLILVYRKVVECGFRRRVIVQNPVPIQTPNSDFEFFSGIKNVPALILIPAVSEDKVFPVTA